MSLHWCHIKLQVVSKKGCGVRRGVGLTSLTKKLAGPIFRGTMARTECKDCVQNPYEQDTWQKSFLVFLETLCRNVAASWYVVVCRKHQPLLGRWDHYLSCLSIPSPWTCTNRLNYHFAGAISPWDEHPLQPVNKWMGHFHEASSQKWIAPLNWPLPAVNTNYRTHCFLFSWSWSSTKATFVLMCL